jgi:hypothetical protein
MPLPSPEVISQIGGWCFAVVVCAAVIWGFVHGDLVPGLIYKRETDRADKTTALIELQTDALENQTGVISTLSKQVETLVTVMGRHE